jgi:hypothetical protein
LKNKKFHTNVTKTLIMIFFFKILSKQTLDVSVWVTVVVLVGGWYGLDWGVGDLISLLLCGPWGVAFVIHSCISSNCVSILVVLCSFIVSGGCTYVKKYEKVIVVRVSYVSIGIGIYCIIHELKFRIHLFI